MQLIILPKLWLIFLLSSEKNIKKYTISDIILTIMSTLGALFVGMFFKTFSRDFKKFKIQVHGVPILNYVLVCKMHLYMPKMTLSSLLTLVLIVCIKPTFLWYIICLLSKLFPFRDWWTLFSTSVSQFWAY